MGVPGLLPALRDIAQRTHLSELSGQRAGVDALCWMHRGATQTAADGHVSFSLAMIDLLLAHSISPVLVFDGQALPCKDECNRGRDESRARNRAAAEEAALAGDSERASTLLRRSICVTDQMIADLVQALRARGVSFMFAPYEADAQLAKLSRMGLVDVVLTEDSDVLIYGARHVLFKLGRDGTGDLVHRRLLGSIESPCSFAMWTDDMFRLFCSVAGCDYTRGVRGVGLRRAHGAVARHRGLAAVLGQLRQAHGACESELRGVCRAWLTYKHQVVFCPLSGRLEHLSPLRPGEAAEVFACARGSASVSRADLDVDTSFLGDVTAEYAFPRTIEASFLPEREPAAVTEPRSEPRFEEQGDEPADEGPGRPPSSECAGPAPPKLWSLGGQLAATDWRRHACVETLQRRKRRLASPPPVAPRAPDSADEIAFVPHFRVARGEEYWDRRLLGPLDL